jgi:hypothetical protein
LACKTAPASFGDKAGILEAGLQATQSDADGARWFKTRFPNKTPWGSGWSNVDGPVVCGIIQLNELIVILDQLEGLIAQDLG